MSETPEERRRWAGEDLTDEDLLRLRQEEDAAFERTSLMMRWRAFRDRVQASMPAGKWSRLVRGVRPRGRPPGPSFTFDDLIAGVDRLRRRSDSGPSQKRLAEECNIGKTQLGLWIADHPREWAALRARWRGLT